MASALSQMASESTFEEPQAPHVYGLDADERALRFGAGDEKFTLRTGNETPVGSNTYVSVDGQAPVYAVPSYRVTSLQKSLEDLRDKRILRFDTSAIDSVSASWPGGRVELRRGDDEWRMEAPVEGPADQAAVDALLSDLSYLRATGFVDDPPSDRKLGLVKPDFHVALAGGSEEEPLKLELAIGRSVDEETRVVRAEGETRYRIPAERIADFPRSAVEYRFRQLSSFSTPSAKRVEVVFAQDPDLPISSEPLTITATRGEEGWTSSPDRFRPGVVARLVSELSRLVAGEIVAESAGPDELVSLRLEPPAATFTVFDDVEGGEQLARVELGVVQGGQWILARMPGNPAIFGIDSAMAEHLPLSLEAFRNRFEAEEELEPEAVDAADSGEEVDPES
jgi:hypothetical protein